MKPMALENSVRAGEASAPTSGEFRPAVFLIRVDRVWSKWVRPECCGIVLFFCCRELGPRSGVSEKKNTRKHDSEANTRLVRFPPIEFSFEKDVERQVQSDTPRITTS